MPRVDALFQLVKALSKSEKRYFKLFAAMQGRDKKYLLLFDAVDAQETYDEQRLKERFRNEKFVRQFSVAKHYLYSLILKSLRLYHSGSTTTQQLRELLTEIEILVDKGLRKEARKRAAKAVDIAKKNEKLPYLLEALVRLDGFDRKGMMTGEGIERMAGRQRQVLDRTRNMLDYGFLIMNVARLTSRGNDIRTREQVEELDRIMADPMLRDKNMAKTARSLMRYHWMHSAHRYVHGDLAESASHSEAIVELLENNVHLLPDHLPLFVAAISNAMHVYELEGNEAALQTVKEKLLTTARDSIRGRTRTSKEESSIFVSLYSHLLSTGIGKGAFDQTLALIPDIEKGIDKYREYLSESELASFCLDIATCWFTVGNYRNALDYCNAILHRQEPVEGGELYRIVRLTALIVHFELGNHSLLRHMIPSTERYLLARDGLHRFERGLIDLLATAVKSKSESRRMRAFRDFRQQIEDLADDPLEQRTLDRFIVADWVESRITGLPVAETARLRRDARESSA